MKFCMNDMIYAFSYALDSVATELLGVSTYHSERVAYLSVLMGMKMGYQQSELSDLAACAALHDNALVEYVQEEYNKGKTLEQARDNFESSKHCIAGEKNIVGFPFQGNVKGAILYHHESADGSGPFKKKTGEIPVFAEIIHLADQLDTLFNLSTPTKAKFEETCLFVKEQESILFSKHCVDAYLKGVTYESIKKIQGNLRDVLVGMLSSEVQTYSREEIETIATLFAYITDVKSSFTGKHSKEIAKKARKMAEFYHYDEERQLKLFFAGAVHDLGKLIIPNDILDKPDKLTDTEFVQIQNHAYYTYKILNKIKGLEDVTRWAALHHEKLNGAGYPFGYVAGQLGFEERLMGCIDIYQALTETRPYKAELSHEETMKIMNNMVKDGFIDGKIVADIDWVFGVGKRSDEGSKMRL